MSIEQLAYELLNEVRSLRSSLERQSAQMDVLFKLSAGSFADSLDIALQQGNYPLLEEAITAGVNLLETDVLYSSISDPDAVAVILSTATDIPANMILAKATGNLRRLSLIDGVASSGQTTLSCLLSSAAYDDERYRMPLRDTMGSGFMKLIADQTSLQQFVRDFQAAKIRRCALRHTYSASIPTSDSISFAATLATLTAPDTRAHANAFWAIVKVDGRQTNADLEELESASAIPEAQSYASIYRRLTQAKVPSSSINLAAEACHRSPALLELILADHFLITPESIKNLEEHTSEATRIL